MILGDRKSREGIYGLFFKGKFRVNVIRKPVDSGLSLSLS